MTVAYRKVCTIKLVVVLISERLQIYILVIYSLGGGEE
jgi:hypothetical protein